MTINNNDFNKLKREMHTLMSFSCNILGFSHCVNRKKREKQIERRTESHNAIAKLEK